MILTLFLELIQRILPFASYQAKALSTLGAKQPLMRNDSMHRNPHILMIKSGQEKTTDKKLSNIFHSYKAGEGAQCRKCQPCSCQPTIITLVWFPLVHWCSDSMYYSINRKDKGQPQNKLIGVD